MSTISQDDRLSMVSFRVPEDFKVALDMEVAKRPKVTLEELCVRTLAEALNIELPEKYRDTQPDASAKKRRAS